MSKISKIVIFLLIILLSVCTFSLATDINMNITEQSNTSNSSNVSTYSNNVNSNNYNNTVNYNITSNDSNSSNRVTDSSNSNRNLSLETEASQTQVSNISKSDVDDGLSLSNVLNILLIVVGVVLILLSIAILIRLNS